MAKKKDAQVFETLKPVADGIAAALGRNCEVVIHDFADLSRSLVHVSGNVTGRKVGAPITDLAYKNFKDHGDGVRDMHGYRTITGSGRILKSSTSFLRNARGKVVGCICVNIDITDFLNAKALMDEFTHLEDSPRRNGQERFANSFNETIDSLIEEAMADMGKQPATMDKEERLELLRKLEAREVFLFKGAIVQVARLFGVSRYTVYNYLKEIRVENGSAT